MNIWKINQPLKVEKQNQCIVLLIDVEDNLSNGMQAMAVAPVIDGQVDISQIVIAYAGTNIWDGGNDFDTDLQSIGLGNNLVMLKSSIDYKSILAVLC
ncbi:hypothetical protein IR114_01500 [Granulicatella sp. 19428wC4_WM01]|uniref:hypothetical protein n=1 Tax=Granulicatella sp. WM01 TaxID=2558277 RepID=UPI001430D750|nr:hypothetical protein [Granulicatella sp. WM01]MBF0779757.1 hypothetical protein [Granulicatella sp. 19428wC4_WM01]